MEYQILRWVTEELEPDQVDDLMYLLARIENRVKLEMIEQFLTVLYEAKQGNLNLDGIIGVVGDWYTDVEEHYRVLSVYEDAVFKQAINKLNHTIEVTKLKREGKIKVFDKPREAVA